MTAQWNSALRTIAFNHRVKADEAKAMLERQCCADYGKDEWRDVIAANPSLLRGVAATVVATAPRAVKASKRRLRAKASARRAIVKKKNKEEERATVSSNVPADHWMRRRDD